MEDKIFGESGSKVVIEEFLTGPEVSVLSFTDGKTVKPMVSSMDHKRALDGDQGLNTGGMGTVAPNPYYTPEIAQQCMDTIFLPTIRAMQEEGRPFTGCLYFGLMLTPKGPKVIEYNCRFGDPETQVVLPLLDTDLVDIMLAIWNGTLDQLDIQWSRRLCSLRSLWQAAAIRKSMLPVFRSLVWTKTDRLQTALFTMQAPSWTGTHS